MDSQIEDNVLTVEDFKRTLEMQKAQAIEILSDCHEEPGVVFHGLIVEKLVQYFV